MCVQQGNVPRIDQELDLKISIKKIPGELLYSEYYVFPPPFYYCMTTALVILHGIVQCSPVDDSRTRRKE